MRGGSVARLFGIFAAVASAGLLLAGCSVASSRAACAARAPSLEATPRRVEPGRPFTLRGDGFIGSFVCDDTGPDVVGNDIPASPARDIRLELRQNGETWRPGTVDAGREMGFEARVEVPDDARPGRATVRAAGSPSAKAPFRVIGDPDPGASAPPTSVSVTTDPKPPTASLSFGKRTVRGERGSYCSTDGCMGIAGFPVPAKKEELIVPAGSGTTLDLGDLNPSSVEAGAAELDGKHTKLLLAPGGPRELVPRGERIWPKTWTLQTRREPGQDLLDLDLPPGEYALEVFVRFPQGDASYYFRVRVEPGTGGEMERMRKLSSIACYAS